MLSLKRVLKKLFPPRAPAPKDIPARVIDQMRAVEATQPPNPVTQPRP